MGSIGLRNSNLGSQNTKFTSLLRSSARRPEGIHICVFGTAWPQDQERGKKAFRNHIEIAIKAH